MEQQSKVETMETGGKEEKVVQKDQDVKESDSGGASSIVSMTTVGRVDRIVFSRYNSSIKLNQHFSNTQ